MDERPEAKPNDEAPATLVEMAPNPCKRCHRAYARHTHMGHSIYCSFCARIKQLAIEANTAADGTRDRFHFGA